MSLTSPPDLTITYNTHHEAYLRFSVTLGGSALSSSQKRFMCLERLHQPVDRFIVKVSNPESCNNCPKGLLRRDLSNFRVRPASVVRPSSVRPSVRHTQFWTPSERNLLARDSIRGQNRVRLGHFA